TNFQQDEDANTADVADNSSGFIASETRSYNRLGQLLEDDQYDPLHFGGDLQDLGFMFAHTDQSSKTTDTYDNHGFLAEQDVHKFVHPTTASSVVTYTYDNDTSILSKYRWIQGEGNAQTLDDIVQFDNTYTHHYTFIAGLGVALSLNPPVLAQDA